MGKVMRVVALVGLGAVLLSCSGSGGLTTGPDRVEHKRARAHPQGQNPLAPEYTSQHPHNGEFQAKPKPKPSPSPSGCPGLGQPPCGHPPSPKPTPPCPWNPTCPRPDVSVDLNLEVWAR